ncbi:hypothetical protein [Streptomyces niveus]|uniref:hypothetical protein n=1 Tax=Streptomyces niveus TaxID=193462 RepID=UPI003657B01B
MAAAFDSGPEWAYEWYPEADAALAVADEEQRQDRERMRAEWWRQHAEIERLTRDLRVSEAKVGGAALYVEHADARMNMLENVVDAYDGIHGERDRYRLAWTSARRRASREANFATEALALQDAELRRLRAFVEEVRDVRGWAMDGTGTYRTHLVPIYDALHELEEAQREGRPSRDRWTRVGPEHMADMCPACHIMPSSVPQPAPCTCGDEPATVAYWRAELERVHQEKVRESTHGAASHSTITTP